jgi:hypothetical protein
MILELIERLAREAEKRGVEFLVIGGHAVVHHGYERMTTDVDFLSEQGAREAWRSILGEFGYELAVETPAFEQFSKQEPGWPQVDIMFVNPSTWENLRGESEAKTSRRVVVRVPSPAHMVALKLHAASSPQRSDPEKDWGDIFQLVKRHRLDPDEEAFAGLVKRYGGEAALERLKKWRSNLP